MKTLYFALGLMSLAAGAQQPPVPVAPASNAPAAPVVADATGYAYISGADIADRIAKADALQASGGHARAQRLVGVGPFSASMEYLANARTPEIHLDDNLYIYVLDGSGEFTIGGKAVNPTQRGRNIVAASGEGGTVYKLTRGSMVLLPANVPGYASKVDGKLVILALHLPMPAPGTLGEEAAPGSETVSYISAAQVADRIAMAAPGAKATTKVGPFLQSAPYSAHLEYHTDVHPMRAAPAEFFIALEGSGDMKLGGTLIDARRDRADMVAAKSEGGVIQKMSAGDMLMVPDGMPHGVTRTDGKLVLMQIKMLPLAPAAAK